MAWGRENSLNDRAEEDLGEGANLELLVTGFKADWLSLRDKSHCLRKDQRQIASRLSPARVQP
jgi:hypothetical protein